MVCLISKLTSKSSIMYNTQTYMEDILLTSRRVLTKKQGGSTPRVYHCLLCAAPVVVLGGVCVRVCVWGGGGWGGGGRGGEGRADFKNFTHRHMKKTS